MKTKFLGSAGRFRNGFERVSRGLRRWADDRRGAIAIQFAFLVVPISVLAFGLIDLNRMNTQKYNLQDSLDAAALYAARSEADTNEELQTEGQKALLANLNLMDGAQLISSSFELDGVKVIAKAEAKMPAVVSNLWTNQDLKVKAHSEVMRNSKNVEVALVLDTTGSMKGQPIIDLRKAAADLIDIVVKPQQTPFYSKVAIVPYSMAVNAGDYADDVRGVIPPAGAINKIAWYDGDEKTVTKVTKASQAVVSAAGHGYSNGDIVYLWSVDNMSGLNSKTYVVSDVETNKFKIKDHSGNYISTSGYSNEGADGKVRRCYVKDCLVVVFTSNNHNFATDDYVYFPNLNSNTSVKDQVNNKTLQVTKVTDTRFSLNIKGPTLTTPSSSSGNAWCTKYGCEYFRFTNKLGAIKLHKVSTCVSERTGASPYVDNYPVSLNYPATGNPCLENKIYPLSSNKDALKAEITALKDEGSTAGHIGVAWGWYMISPNFGNLWSDAASKPAAYNAPHTLKVVVWMTDGANNTAYHDGVISKDSTSGSGADEDHINTNATNGSSSAQTLALCSAMKAKGVIVYAVGFNIAGNQPAIDVVNGCATDAEHVYLPSGGTALSEAFSAIGSEIENLRLSK